MYPPSAVTYKINRPIYRHDDWTLKLTTIVVTGKIFKATVRYHNNSKNDEWLICPATKQTTIVGSKPVSAKTSYCEQNVGSLWSVPPGRESAPWAIFPNLPDRWQPFTLNNWYNWVSVRNISLDSHRRLTGKEWNLILILAKDLLVPVLDHVIDKITFGRLMFPPVFVSLVDDHSQDCLDELNTWPRLVMPDRQTVDSQRRQQVRPIHSAMDTGAHIQGAASQRSTDTGIDGPAGRGSHLSEQVPSTGSGDGWSPICAQSRPQETK